MAKPCYVPDNSPEAYQIIPTFDTNPDQCSLENGVIVSLYSELHYLKSNGNFIHAFWFQLVDRYFSGATSNEASLKAFAYYAPELPLIHFRCLVQNRPVCRPDLFPDSTSQQCDEGTSQVR